MRGMTGCTTRRILVIRAGALGDCLLMLPALAALRAHFPQARIEAMGYPERWQWVLGRGLIDAVQSIERPGMHLLFCRDAEVPESLRAFVRGYDIILSYRPDPDGLFADNLRRLGAGRVLSQSPFPAPPNTHVADFALQLVAELGIPPLAPVPRLPLVREDLTLVEPFFSRHGVESSTERLLVIHPGSGSEAKRWPIDNFAGLLEALSGRPRLRTIIVAGYADEGLVDRLLPLVAHLRPLIAARWPMSPTAALIAQATVFVGHDSGLTHLAAAFGRPTVALFGPTDPSVWGPRGEAVTVIRIGQNFATEVVPAPGGTSAPAAAPGELQQVIAAVERWLARADLRRSPDDRSV
jgi:ADP-heptose:LPS heptosyltransferase